MAALRCRGACSRARQAAPAVAGVAATAALISSNVAHSTGFIQPATSPETSVVAQMHVPGGQNPTAVRATAITAAAGAPTRSASHGLARLRMVSSPAVASLLAAAAGYRQERRRQQQRGPAVARRGGDGGDIEDLVPFEIRGFSLAQLFLAIGIFLIVYTLVDYYYTVTNGGGNGIGSLFLIYSFPVFLLGAALTYAEIQPVPVETASDAEGLMEARGTGTLKKIKSDVTRHRYGDDAHLDSSLKALGLYVKGTYPEMLKILETKTSQGELEFTMLFKSKQIPYNTWSDPMMIKKYDRFFGPGIWASVYKYSKEERIAALKLTTGKRPTEEEEKVSAAYDAAVKARQEEEAKEAALIGR